jgi:hypothetical protein
MKKSIFFIVIIFAVLLSACQSSGAAGQTGSLEVHVSWQTDVWKPGTEGTLVLPDTEVVIHPAFSNSVVQSGVTDLLGVYLVSDLPSGWYWVEAVHQPEGLQESDFGKHWVAHMIHITAGETKTIDFNFDNAGGWMVW